MPWTIDKNANANITQRVLFGARCGACQIMPIARGDNVKSKAEMKNEATS
jgi:hypothetical protein